MSVEIERMIANIFGDKGNVTESSLRHDIGILCCKDSDHFHQFERTGIEARMASDKEYRKALGELAGLMEDNKEKPKCLG